MTHFSPEEQAVYEAELRAQFEANDYEEIKFTVANVEYTAVLNDSGTTVYDDMGDTVVWLPAVNIDDKEALEGIVIGYLQGFSNGYNEGRKDKVIEICEALGVSNG